MRSLVAAAVVLALLAGPSLGACGDCCPPAPAPLSVAAAAPCCGDCGTTVGRAPEPASLAAATTVSVPLATAPLSLIAFVSAPPASTAVVAAPARRPSPPLPPPLPLRL